MVTITVVGGYRPPPECFTATSRRANSAIVLGFRTLAKLYVYDTLLQRLPQDLEDMAALGPFIQEEHAVVGQRHFARPRQAAADQPDIEDGVMGARNGRVVTKAVRSPVRPATLWMRVVSMASARVMAGRMVVSRRASIDLPAPGGPSRSTLWAERLHNISLHQCLSGCR